MFRGDYVLYGAEPSYFTRKVQGIFRFKKIPHEFRFKSLDVRDEVEDRVGTHLIPAVHTPEDWFLWDSTPIAFWMERMHPDPSILPEDSYQRTACRILEDWLDEWLTRSALHYRWTYEPDRSEVGLAIAKNMAGVPREGETTDEIEDLRDMILDWADTATESMAAGEEHADEVNASFEGFINVVDDHLREYDFLLGDRPCLADFALLGAMKAHFATDPKPLEILKKQAPRLLDYTDRLWESRGRDGSWPADGTLPSSTIAILEEISGDFGTYLKANREALARGEDYVTLDLGYGDQDIATRWYTERCRVDLMDDLKELPKTEREPVDELLDEVGLLEVYEVPAAPDVERHSPSDDRR